MLTSFSCVVFFRGRRTLTTAIRCIEVVHIYCEIYWFDLHKLLWNMILFWRWQHWNWWVYVLIAFLHAGSVLELFWMDSPLRCQKYLNICLCEVCVFTFWHIRSVQEHRGRSIIITTYSGCICIAWGILFCLHQSVKGRVLARSFGTVLSIWICFPFKYLDNINHACYHLGRYGYEHREVYSNVLHFVGLAFDKPSHQYYYCVD